MINKERHEPQRAVSRRQMRREVPLSAFDGQRMAVEMHRGGERIVLRGTAVYVRDDAVGNTLTIRFDDGQPGHPVLVVSESEWDGRIVPDFHYGCEFCLIVG